MDISWLLDIGQYILAGLILYCVHSLPTIAKLLSQLSSCADCDVCPKNKH